MRRLVKAPIIPATIAALGLILLMAGCVPRGPDLGPFASAVKWLGVCIVLSSLIWAIGIVLFGRSRK